MEIIIWYYAWKIPQDSLLSHCWTLFEFMRIHQIKIAYINTYFHRVLVKSVKRTVNYHQHRRLRQTDFIFVCVCVSVCSSVKKQNERNSAYASSERAVHSYLLGGGPAFRIRRRDTSTFLNMSYMPVIDWRRRGWKQKRETICRRFCCWLVLMMRRGMCRWLHHHHTSRHCNYPVDVQECWWCWEAQASTGETTTTPASFHRQWYCLGCSGCNNNKNNPDVCCCWLGVLGKRRNKKSYVYRSRKSTLFFLLLLPIPPSLVSSPLPPLSLSLYNWKNVASFSSRWNLTKTSGHL